MGISKFITLHGKEKLLFIEALALHLWAGLLLKIIPFKWVPRLFSSPQFETPTKAKSRTRSVGKKDQSRHNLSGQQSEVIEMVKVAIQRAGKVSPWRNRCLVSSLAGRCMLRRRKIDSQLSLGVARNPDGKTISHAWLKAGNIEIVGRNGDYTELFSF